MGIKTEYVRKKEKIREKEKKRINNKP